MRILSTLWNDEAGVLLSAEAVVVGTVAVVGLTAGLSTVATSVNEELKDVAYAIRSLDQSYSIPAMHGCGAMTAGSSFTQEPVKNSLKELDTQFQKAEQAEKAAARSQQDRMKQQMKRQEAEKKNNSRKDAGKKPAKNSQKI